MTEVGVRWHLEGYAQVPLPAEASIAVPVVSRRVDVAVRRHVDRDARFAALQVAALAFPIAARTPEVEAS
jgi:hypothetical protein